MDNKTKWIYPLFNTAIALIGIAGLGNLALSQIHIGTITRVFAPQIGFYFFLYIIFGLVSFLNALNMKKKENNVGNAVLMVLVAGAAVISGYVYINMLLADVASENLLTSTDIAPALYIAIISSAIYGIGSLIILIFGNKAKDML